MTRTTRHFYKGAESNDQVMAMPPIGSSNYMFLTWCPKCKAVVIFKAHGWDVSDKSGHRFKWPEQHR